MGQVLHTTACCKLVAPSLLLSDTYIDESPATQTRRTFQNEREPGDLSSPVDLAHQKSYIIC